MDADARSARLADARVYLCTDARERQGDLADFLEAVLGSGVDIVQLRQKGPGGPASTGGLEARAELAALEVFADACARHGALLAVNDRADVAYAAGADALHLGQDDLPVGVARALLGPDVIIGRSTHARPEVDAAVAETGSEYYCVGPCWPTPTKPGRPAPGLDLVTYAASQRAAKPWFAIGGIDLANLDAVLAAGARRVVVVRMLTEAADPGAAARELAGRLRSVPASAPSAATA